MVAVAVVAVAVVALTVVAAAVVAVPMEARTALMRLGAMSVEVKAVEASLGVVGVQEVVVETATRVRVAPRAAVKERPRGAVVATVSNLFAGHHLDWQCRVW